MGEYDAEGSRIDLTQAELLQASVEFGLPLATKYPISSEIISRLTTERNIILTEMFPYETAFSPVFLGVIMYSILPPDLKGASASVPIRILERNESNNTEIKFGFAEIIGGRIVIHTAHTYRSGDKGVLTCTPIETVALRKSSPKTPEEIALIKDTMVNAKVGTLGAAITSLALVFTLNITGSVKYAAGTNSIGDTLLLFAVFDAFFSIPSALLIPPMYLIRRHRLRTNTGTGKIPRHLLNAIRKQHNPGSLD